MSKHIFENVCLDFAPILAIPNIKNMLKEVEKQAKTEEAKKRTDFPHYKDYGQDEWSPVYFGLFVEWFAEQFLNHFGHVYNIFNVHMMNVEGDVSEDLGVDGMGLTMNDKDVRGSAVKAPRHGDVYIQVKGTLNFQKKHTPNDGSRLPNFTTNAMSSAIISGKAYQSRYILFTTADGIHYTLKKMWNGMVEVIGIDQIQKLVNNNIQFLNILRTKVGLPELDIPLLSMDPEAVYNIGLELKETA